MPSLNVNCNIAGTDMVGGAGAVAAGVQRVTLASDDPAVAALGAISGAAVITDANGTIQQYLRGLVTLSLVDNVVLDNMLTALQAIDNSVDGNYQNVNLNIAGVDCDGNSGNKSAQTLRVVLATDQPQLTNKLLVTEDNSGSIKTAVETIDNAISGAGFNITQFAGAAVPIGAGVEATALRVTIATDSTGVLSVDDNGGALTVDGTVTANLSATDNTVLDSIQTAVEVIDNCISGSEAQVDVVAALPAGSNNIGDVDIASIASGSINGPAAPVVDSYVHAAINLAAGANQVLASSSANHQIWVYGFGIVCSAAGTVSFQDEDDTAVSGIMPFAANSGMAVPPSGNFAMPIWKLATDKDLEVDIVTAEVDGWIDYAIVNA
jgi:hypothetical protein